MRKLSLLLMVVVLVMAVGCTSGSNKAEGEGKAAATTKAVEVPNPPAWPGSLAMNIAPEIPEPNKPAKFTVTLTGADGKPVTGAKVRASLVMPEMDMGKNEFDLEDKGQGVYEGEGKFTMSGAWKAVVFAQKDEANGGKVFDVRAAMPKP